VAVPELLVLLAAGLAAGALSGLFGIGGGIVMTPVLVYALGRPWEEAVALSLFAIALQSPLGVWQHRRRGAVDLRLALPIAVAGLLGVAFGDWLLPRTPVPWLKLAFALLMAFAAYRMVASVPAPRVDDAPMAALAGLGVAAGLASRLFGIGGGLLTVPVLVLMGTRTHVAVGSSLVPVFVAAAAATVVHLARGTLALLDGLVLAFGALAGVTGGVRLAHALPERGLRRVFAIALVVAAVYVAATSGV